MRDQEDFSGLHHHDRHLVVWSTTAAFAVHADGHDWAVLPSHALWVPAGTPHSGTVLRPGRSHDVLLDTGRSPFPRAEATDVLLTPLIRELLAHLARDRERTRTRLRAENLLLDLLEGVPGAAFRLPMPQDARIRTIAEALVADPSDSRDLSAWADTVNAGARTLTRLFVRETGMPFGQWRAHARVRAALGQLAQGSSVAATARAVGYRRPAAFTDAFRRLTGRSPSDYQAHLHSEGDRGRPSR
ncbi:helix-turn-helix domain-containing protein [Streptomyces sp. NPDC002680]|uniref:helix-turn-helix domain-containing protein n=1 Tax=Streptomyces sp. NPDC002680 TaxID=3364659 RepID=UPI0036A6D091